MQVFVFPGQGSQRRGMGKDLFDKVPEFTGVEQEIDGILGYSVRQLCLEGPDNQLSQTQYTQPCLYIANALHYYSNVATGLRPNYVAGHSLGEYNALMAAGAFDFVTGVRLVQKRSELMAKAKNGAMAAVIGVSPEMVMRLLALHQLKGLDIANYNSPTQVVVSGLEDEVKRAGPIMEKAGAKMYVPLPVSAAFHSRHMADAAREFDGFLSGFEFHSLKIPVVSNVTGQAYPSGATSSLVRSLLVKQMVRPVLWIQSIRFLLGRDASTFTETGPGDVLMRLISQIRQPPVSSPMRINRPEPAAASPATSKIA
jgi:malonyl CoA-acyl carrier protein transacylase